MKWISRLDGLDGVLFIGGLVFFLALQLVTPIHLGLWGLLLVVVPLASRRRPKGSVVAREGAVWSLVAVASVMGVLAGAAALAGGVYLLDQTFQPEPDFWSDAEMRIEAEEAAEGGDDEASSPEELAAVLRALTGATVVDPASVEGPVLEGDEALAALEQATEATLERVRRGAPMPTLEPDGDTPYDRHEQRVEELATRLERAWMDELAARRRALLAPIAVGLALLFLSVYGTKQRYTTGAGAGEPEAPAPSPSSGPVTSAGAARSTTSPLSGAALGALLGGFVVMFVAQQFLLDAADTTSTWISLVAGAVLGGVAGFGIASLGSPAPRA